PPRSTEMMERSSRTSSPLNNAPHPKSSRSRPSTPPGPTLPDRHRPPVKTANCCLVSRRSRLFHYREKFRYLRVALVHHTSPKRRSTLLFAFRSTERDDRIVDVHKQTTMIDVPDAVYPPACIPGQ